jgi:hypothetical protein
MKSKNSLFYWSMLLTICGLLFLGCEEESLITDVSTTDQGLGKSTHAAQAADIFRENFDVPVDFTAFSQCAGEELHFTGAFHWNSVTVIDAQGGFHSVFVANDHSLVGIGLTTGIMYHEVGAFTEVFNFRGTEPGGEYTFTATLSYIGQGPANNAINRANFHFTVNANGITTVEFDNMTQILCQ